MPVVIGQKYTKLTPIYELPERTKSRGKIYHCVCDCGSEIDVPGASLVTGNTKSCGCLHAESIKKAGERIRVRNQYNLTGEYGIGWTLNTNKEFYFDLEDYDIIKDYHWTEKADSGYIWTVMWDNNKPRHVFMHRLIMQQHGHNISELVIDHRYHVTNDNRKENLRICEHYQNIVATKTYTNNTSGRKGVSWDKNRNKWIVSITVNKKTYHIGRYDNFEDAVKAREEAEETYHQEFHYDDTTDKNQGESQ